MNIVGVRFNMKRLKIVLAVIVTVLVGCQSKKFQTEEDLWDYVRNPENKLLYTKDIGNVNYQLTYRPTDILVKQELDGSAGMEELDSLRKKYAKYFYFNLSMSLNDQEILNGQVANRNTFATMLKELSFGMGSKVYLISQKRDTVPLSDYIYPRMYGMGGNTNLLLVYPREEKLLEGEYFHFRIQDFGLGTGEIGFKIPTEPFKKEPKLEFQINKKS